MQTTSQVSRWYAVESIYVPVRLLEFRVHCALECVIANLVMCACVHGQARWGRGGGRRKASGWPGMCVCVRVC